MDKIKNPISLKLIGFNKRQLNSFSAVLELAHFGLRNEWQIVTSPYSDFYILNGIQNHSYNKIPKNRCFYYLPYEEKDKKDTIFHDHLHIPFLHKLIEILNSGSENVGIRQDKMDFVEMIRLLKRLTKTKVPLAIGLTNDIDKDKDKLYIDPANHSFYHVYSIEKIYEDLFSGQAISVENISRKNINTIVKSFELRPRTTNDLIWHIAFTASNGKLIDGLSEHEIINLRRWPYFGIGSLKYAKIAEHLKNNTTSLSKMTSELGIAPSVANDFYNASYLAGHIDRQLSAANTSSQDTMMGELNIFDKIRNHFKH